MSGRILLLSVALLATACSTAASPPEAMRVVATPVVTPAPTPEPTPEPPTPEPTPPPTPRPVQARPAAPAVRVVAAPPPPTEEVPSVPVAAAPASGDLAAFAGLGAWIDVFDIPSSDDPGWIVPKVRDMVSRGVRTLYLETSRFDHPTHISNPRTVAAGLEEAHRLGMRAVAWYPPDFMDLDRDVDRTLAAVHYVSPNGHRFDAVAPDIERTDVKDPAERNRRLIEYSERVRAGSPSGYLLAAITIAPTSLQSNKNRWPDFPWTAISGLYDVFMPMAYWTGTRADPEYASWSAETNTSECRRLSGRPCHTIGGVASAADPAQVAAYVEKALAAGSIGGGIYDYMTTREELWPELQKLNR